MICFTIRCAIWLRGLLAVALVANDWLAVPRDLMFRRIGTLYAALGLDWLLSGWDVDYFDSGDLNHGLSREAFPALEMLAGI